MLPTPHRARTTPWTCTPTHGSDVEATLSQRAVDLRHGLIGAGVYASHGYERSHVDGVWNTLKVLAGYLEADGVR